MTAVTEVPPPTQSTASWFHQHYITPPADAAARCAEMDRYIDETFAKLNAEEQVWAALRLDRELCKADPFYFMVRYCKTHDDDAPEDESKVRPFPELAYIRNAVRIMQLWPDVWFAKSRRQMFSWIASALDLWDALFHSGRRIFVHSFDEPSAGFGGAGETGDTDSVLGRILWMYELLPSHLKLTQPNKGENPRRQNKPPISLTFYHLDPETNMVMPSVIIAVADSLEPIHGKTIGRLHNDEVSFQKDSRRWYGMAKPGLGRHGRGVNIFTPNGHEYGYSRVMDIDLDNEAKSTKNSEAFEEIMPLEDFYSGAVLNDILDDKTKVPLGPRFEIRTGSKGQLCCLVYWRSDPTKDKEFKRTVIDTMDEWQGRMEFELDFEAAPDKHTLWYITSRNIVDEIPLDPSLPIIRVWDFGGHAGMLYAQIYPFLHPVKWFQLRIVAEQDFKGTNTYIMAPQVKNFSDTRFPGFVFDDIYDVAGHQVSATRSEDHTSIVRKTIGVYLKELGSARRVGLSEGISVVGAKMTVEYVPPPDNDPRWEAFGLNPDPDNGTPKLPGFLISQRWAPVLSRALRTRAVVMDKKTGGLMDNTAQDWYIHLCDALKYIGAHRLRYEEVIQPFREYATPEAPIIEDNTPAGRLKRWNDKILAECDRDILGIGADDPGQDRALFPDLDYDRVISGEL